MRKPARRSRLVKSARKRKPSGAGRARARREDIEELRVRLEEAEEALRAIREGEVDAIVVSGARGERVFSLSGAETVYRLIVETMKEAALTVSLEGRILFANAQFAGFVAQPLGEVIGRPLEDFVVPEGRAAIPGLLQTSRQSSAKDRVVFQGPTGARVPAHVSANVLRQKDDVSICIVATDLSELEKSTELLQELRLQQDALAESEARYRTLVEMDPDALAVHQDGRWVYVNPSARKLLGAKRPEDLIGQEFLRSIHPDDREAVGDRVRRLSDGSAVALPLRLGRILRLDGTEVAVETTSAAITYHASPAIQMVIRDVSERERTEAALKRSEDALRQANDRLEQKVEARTAELREAVRVLRDEVQLREQAQEEVRLAHAQLVARAAQLRALAGELTLTEQRERRRLARLLHDHLQQLLVGARFRVGSLQRANAQRVGEIARDVEHLIEQAIDSSRSLTAELSPPILHEGGLRLAFEWLARWMAETHRLIVQLDLREGGASPEEDVKVLLFESVRELLFNVVKHAHVAEAKLTAQQAAGPSLEIVVEDQGAGFDPAETASAGATRGGLGLFSIRERLELIGGELATQSVPGQGSRFVLRVPLAKPEATHRPEPGSRSVAHAPLTPSGSATK